MTPINIEVTTRGDVSEHAREQAREKLGGLERLVKGPILGARVVLTQEANPRIPMPRAGRGGDRPSRPARPGPHRCAVDGCSGRRCRRAPAAASAAICRAADHARARAGPGAARRMVASRMVSPATHRRSCARLRSARSSGASRSRSGRCRSMRPPTRSRTSIMTSSSSMTPGRRRTRSLYWRDDGCLR